MSVASKRRYIANKVDSEMFVPSEGDVIAHVKAARGNNLHEVEDEFGATYLVSMPSKFRKTVWIRRGQFVVIRPIEEGDKVRAEIEHVLDEENILYIYEELKKWPESFSSHASQMTRESRRGGAGAHAMIDDDMMPPSSSDEDEDEDCDDDEEEEDGESGDDEEEGAESEEDSGVCNPNRSRAPANKAGDA